MNKQRKKRLEAAGFRVGTVQEFLDLSDEDLAYVEMRVELAKALKDLRRSLKMTQTAFAKLVGSSQSRVAKMERADPSVKLDLLMKSLIRGGKKPKDIGKALAKVA